MKQTEYNKEHMARVNGVSLPISTKSSIEICNAIRGKKLARAKTILKDAIELKKAIPLRRFKRDVGHKTKIGPGRYMTKVSEEILGLLNAVEANAQFKGLNTSNLIISKLVPNRSSTQWHYGRQRRRQMKRTNIEVVVQEGKIKETKVKEKITKESKPKEDKK